MTNLPETNNRVSLAYTTLSFMFYYRDDTVVMYQMYYIIFDCENLTYSFLLQLCDGV